MGWDPDRPLRELPDHLQEYFRERAQCLLEELVSNRLEVVLIPAPEPNFGGHMIRVAQNHNPSWYSELYHEYPHFRRDRSIKALESLKEGTDRPFVCGPFKYQAIYRELILDNLTEGFTTVMGERVEPLEEVVQGLGEAGLSAVPF